MYFFKTYSFSDPDLKQKLLHWASGFGRVCFLDSNGFSYRRFSGEEVPSYDSYECLVAVDAVEEIAPEQNGFDALKKFYAAKGEWHFGFLTYDLKNETENLTSTLPDRVGMPLLHFFKPRYVFEVGKEKLTIHVYGDREDADAIFSEINNIQQTQDSKLKPTTILNRLSKPQYINILERIKQHIQLGDIYELNFCQEFYSENCTIHPVQVYQHLTGLSPMPFSCFYRYGGNYLLSASPERFLKKEGNKIISQPIKGTIRKGMSEAEDRLLIDQLYNDPKERSENVMITDLVRNDLSRTAKKGSVSVEELYGVYSFKQVHQMISTVRAELRDGISSIDAIKAAFPMGSMTGAPKVKAMELIEKYETSKRGLFSGAVGYFSPDGNFDFNVVIRSILYNESSKYLSFMTGSAITYNSAPEKEYEECMLKAKSMIEALRIEM